MVPGLLLEAGVALDGGGGAALLRRGLLLHHGVPTVEGVVRVEAVGWKGFGLGVRGFGI